MGPVDAPNPPAEKSRQPSPAGQGDALLEQVARFLDYSVGHDPWPNIRRVYGDAWWEAVRKMRDDLRALAARQPVGQEPVASIVPSAHVCHDGSWEDGPDALCLAEEADDYVRRVGAPLYAAPPARAVDLGPEPMFYIQDTRQFVGNCPMWWGPNGSGYVTRLDEAGRYTEQEAIRQNRTRETDIPWPCSEIDALARQTVDCQHMRPRAERLAELALIDSKAVG